MTMWGRVVWREKDKTYEDTIPLCWVQGQQVRWPTGISWKAAMNSSMVPAKEWKSFELIKIKHKSTNIDDCHQALSTSSETENAKTKGLSKESSMLSYPEPPVQFVIDDKKTTRNIDTDLDQTLSPSDKYIKEVTANKSLSPSHSPPALSNQTNSPNSPSLNSPSKRPSLSPIHYNSPNPYRYSSRWKHDLRSKQCIPNNHRDEARSRSRSLYGDDTEEELRAKRKYTCSDSEGANNPVSHRNTKSSERRVDDRNVYRLSYSTCNSSNDDSPSPLGKKSSLRKRSNSSLEHRHSEVESLNREKNASSPKKRKSSIHDLKSTHRSSEHRKQHELDHRNSIKDNRHQSGSSSRNHSGDRFSSKSGHSSFGNTKKVNKSPEKHTETEPLGDRLLAVDKSPKNTQPKRKHPFPWSTAKYQERSLMLLTDIRNMLNDFSRKQNKEVDLVSFEKCSSIEDFEQLEQTLVTKEERKALVSKLSRIGGNDLPATVKNIMRRLEWTDKQVMSYGLMANFNMTGRNRKERRSSVAKEKKSFVDTNFFRVVVDCALRLHKGANESDVKAVMTKVLTTAPDRPGGGGRFEAIDAARS